VSIDRPPPPPAYRPPEGPEVADGAGASAAGDGASPEPRPVPPQLARLAARHPLVIAAVLVSLVVTWITVVATLAAFAASAWWVFDILTSYRPQFFLVLLVGIVALAALRCWRTLPIAVLALALNAVVVAPVFTGHQAPAAKGSPFLTIAHLNLQSRTGDLPAIHSWLETTPADIVVFLHTAGRTTASLRGGVGRYTMIYPHYLGQDFKGKSRYDPPSPEIIVMSDQPGATASTPTMNGLPSNAVFVDADLGKVRVHLLALHTLSPGTSARQSVRNSELAAVGRWLRREPKPAIAFGDFNTTYYSPELQDLLHTGHATSSQVGFGIQATWPHQFRPAGIAIDQSVYTGHITAIARHRGPSLGSEHRSLIVTYALAA
jgi:endonuclease/exonuclease/phosphatase (EEP) superfamily protein YafD